ncbi:hypothetical protein QP185_15425 [Sphingomonas aerolata]|uniref:hypothetical protein n=1 Tax=Sphingomonas aerolata TaxID=185951 RepID=UPI002FE13676
MCDRLQPQIGMPIHALNQYECEARPNAIGVFGFETLLGVEAVVADGPAARAGVRSGIRSSCSRASGNPGLVPRTPRKAPPTATPPRP